MLSSRNIHFAILGIILGAASGYIFAFYQAESSFPKAAPPATAQGGDIPAAHAEMNDEQMLELLKKAIDENPNQPEVLARYANALFNVGKFQEAVDWYAKAIELEPGNLDVRSLRGAVLWRMGKPDEARTELEAALKQDANHIPSLHGMTLLALDRQDLQEARSLMQRIEKIDPSYGGLEMIRQKLAEAQAPPAGTSAQ